MRTGINCASSWPAGRRARRSSWKARSADLWLADELAAAGLEPHLAGSRQAADFRRTRGQAKNNRLDADLLSALWDEKERWWEVWLAPPEVRDQRELFRLRAGLVPMP